MILQNFPQEIFVTIEETGIEDEYMATHRNMNDALGYENRDSVHVGRYVLQDTLVVSSEVKFQVL